MRLHGKAALITGAARGQGRSDAIRLAAEGADIIAIDVAHSLSGIPYPGSTREDLAETVRAVEALGRRIVAREADVRDYATLAAAVDDGVRELRRLDVVVTDAAVFDLRRADEIGDELWDTVVGVNLTGVWHTAKAAIPHLRAAGGGSIVIMNATLGLKAYPEVAHMVAAKHGAVGLMRVLALELAPDGIRVNTINPSTINTPMVQNDWFYDYLAPDIPPAERTEERMRPLFTRIHPLGNRWAEPEDVSNAVAWLASDESRLITGVALPVDGGTLQL